MPLHGRLSYIPARDVSIASDWQGDDYALRIGGKMREAVVFGTNLELTREISTTLGEKCIRLSDRIENLSVDPSPLMYVYHCNPGFPLLDAGSRLVLHSQLSTEWLEDQPVEPEVYAVAKGPQRRERDDAFVHRPMADADDMVHVALVNDRLELARTGSSSGARYPSSTSGNTSQRHVCYGHRTGQRSMLGRAWNRTRLPAADRARPSAHV